MKFTRRDFIATSALGSATLALGQQTKPAEQREATGNYKRPVIICKTTQLQAIDGAYEMLRRGADTLDAAIFVGKAQEDDPNDTSVGLGGLPNEEGEVELDSCCMHGPTRRAGAVGGVRGIKNVSLLAKAVMDHTGHVMLNGRGAEQFAKAMGFPQENLLTERSRLTWLLWKESNSNKDWWGPGLADPKFEMPKDVTAERASELRREWLMEKAGQLGIEREYREIAVHHVMFPPTGMIHVSVVNEKGEMSGMTTTSGLAWKLAGRLGDSPIIGAGSYTDQDVGSAGATGSGEENIKVCGAYTIVENMRKGMSPTDAGLDALKRIARNHNNDMNKVRLLDMVYYILRKDGAYAGVSLWSGTAERPRRFLVHDGEKRIEKTTALYQGNAIGWPPIPSVPRAQ